VEFIGFITKTILGEALVFLLLAVVLLEPYNYTTIVSVSSIDLFMMNAHSRRGATSRVVLWTRRWTFVLSIIFCISIIIFIITQLKTLASTNNSSTDGCLVSFGTYHGNKYESTATDAFKTTSGEITIGNKCLIQSQWMRVAQHQVQITNNNNNNNNNKATTTTKVINDWLWIDYHDRINVLVQDPNSSMENPSFLILKQTKYALSSQESLAVVGGIVEPNEEPLVAARREVEEELHVTCNSWTSLGRYRTDVNRGMGWVHPYLARDCSYSKIIVGSDEEESNGDVGVHDMEKQNVQSMTLSEVKASVMDQKFVEVQWSNTVALAMLHLMA
jgi:ADP-ribose pyrophosphatase